MTKMVTAKYVGGSNECFVAFFNDEKNLPMQHSLHGYETKDEIVRYLKDYFGPVPHVVLFACSRCSRTLTAENNSVGFVCDNCLADDAAEHNNSYHSSEY